MRITVGLSCSDTVVGELRATCHRSVFPISPTTQLLLATSVQDLAYRSAISLGIPVMRPEGLRKQIDEDTMREYRLPLFAGLSIATSGLHAAERSRIERFVRENGGTISSLRDASHIVLDPAGVLSHPKRDQKIVRPEWIRECEDLGWCASEKSFLVQPKLKRRSACRRGQCEGAEETEVPEKVERIEERPIDVPEGAKDAQSPSFLSPRSSQISDHGKYRRYQLAMELYQSEINTLKSIDFVVRLSVASPLSQSLSDRIFYAFHALHPAYTRLISSLGDSIGKWNDESTIGDIYTQLTDCLLTAFLPYFHSLESSLIAYKKALKDNQKFAQFVEEREKDRSIGRQKIEQLISAPSQQLMSRSTIMLKEILQHTQPQHDDFNLLQGAVVCVDGILEQANENRKMSAEVDDILAQIENAPAVFFLAPRKLLGRFSVQSQGGTGNWNHHGTTLVLLLNDFVLVANTIDADATCLRSQREETSRYASHVSYDSIREVIRVEKDDHALFSLILRSDLSDEEWRIEDGGDEVEIAVQTVMKQVRLLSPRAISIHHQPFSSSPLDRQAALMAMINPQEGGGGFHPRRSLSKLRTLSGRLKRMRQNNTPASPSSSQSTQPSLPTSPLQYRSPSTVYSSSSSQDSAASTGSSIGWSLDENDSRLVQSVEPYENGRRFVPLNIRSLGLKQSEFTE